MKGGMGRPRMEAEMGVVPKVPNQLQAMVPRQLITFYIGSWLRWGAAGMVPWTKVTDRLPVGPSHFH